jgi:hypothetical protein
VTTGMEQAALRRDAVTAGATAVRSCWPGTGRARMTRDGGSDWDWDWDRDAVRVRVRVLECEHEENLGLVAVVQVQLRASSGRRPANKHLQLLCASHTTGPSLPSLFCSTLFPPPLPSTAVLLSSWLQTSPRSPSCSRPAWTRGRTSKVRRRVYCCPSMPPSSMPSLPPTPTDTCQPSRPSPRSRPSPTSPSRSSTLSPPTRSPPQSACRAPSTSRTSSSATGSTRMATTSCPRTRSSPSSASSSA